MKKKLQDSDISQMQTVKSSILTTLILLVSFYAFTQAESWKEMANTSFGRSGAVGFSIGNKGYMGTGSISIANEPKPTYLKDFWEYNAATNIWSQKANFGGSARRNAVGFSLGSRGYIGTGNFDNDAFSDFWEYDPIANIWTKKADYPGEGRLGVGVGFNINNKGYIGIGMSPRTLNPVKDFWEYDPVTDFWAKKADLSGSPRSLAMGFSICDKGYIGAGMGNDISHLWLNDFWEYNPAANLWIQKADYPGLSSDRPAAFGIGSKGYAGLATFGEDFWEYNPSTNLWSRKADLIREHYSSDFGFSFSIGNKGYVGPGGLDGFWQYTPTPEANNSITANIASTTFCAGSPVEVKFVPTGSFSENSFFTAQLSDPTGDFATPVSIGNLKGLGSGIIKAIIPANTIPGNTYRIRVVSIDPPSTGTDNGKDLAIIKPQTNTWVQKADFIGGARYLATGFSIGSKGYIGTGWVNGYGVKNDFWEYDPATETWSQKADFGGGARQNAVGFSIGSKGYIGIGGFAPSPFLIDFWEYDPAANTWTKKADFGGTPRISAVGFGIGNKGYIGTGSGGFGQDKGDFWEYDPATNTWTKKADFAGGARNAATGFSIGSKGYMGTGYVDLSDQSKNDFWEYNPGNNTWLQKADFAGGPRGLSTGFSIGNKGYIGQSSSGFTNDFWEYDLIANTWAQKASFGGGGRYAATGFSIGSYGYMGLGSGFSTDQLFHEKNDWWQYTPTPETKTSITTTIASTTFCTGSPVDVNFVPTGAVNENSFFTVQLSDPTGNFAKAVSIGKQSGFGTGIIKAIIPFNTIPGNTYRIRVVSNNPTFAGSNNGANITINQGPVLTSAITVSAICNNTVFSYTPAAIPAGTLFSWSRPVVAGITNPAANSTAENTTGVISEKLINTRTAPVNVAYNYLLNNNGCNNIAYKVMVTVKPSPLVKTKNITVYLNANGVVTITPNQVDNGSVSYCGSISYSLDKTSFNCSNIGVNNVKLTVKDCIGNESTGNTCVTVKDNLPPVITDANTNPAILWPPNHSMRNVTVNYLVKDNCCVASTAITVTSNEPPVNNERDWIVLDKHHLQLRAERRGRGCGRVYTITISAKDVSGNTSTKVVTVTVPHHQNLAKSEAAIVGFDAADNGLSVQAMPNPSKHYFTLITKSKSDAPFAIRVTDAAGKLIEVRNNVAVKSKLELGNGYRTGTYYVQVIQGNNKATITLVKQGN